MKKLDLLDEILINFFERVPDTLGIVICDKNAEIIHSKIVSGKVKNSGDGHDKESHSIGSNAERKEGKIDEKKLSKFNTEIKPFLAKMQDQFSSQKKYGSSVIDTNDFRLLNILADTYVYTFVLDIFASLSTTYPYVYLAVEKMHQVIDEGKVPQTKIPRLGNIRGEPLDEPIQGKNDEWSIKYILLGEPSVGKTSVVNRFVHKTFETDYRPTIGLNVMTHNYEFYGHKIKMNIYDIGSQKLFRRVRPNYYSGANIAIFVFSLDKPETLQSLPKWYKEMARFVGDEIPMLIVGNKSDLTHKVSFSEGESFAKKYNCSYIETSALEGANIEDAFSLISYIHIEKYKKQFVQEE